jgi:hypothetical protein
LCFPASAPKTRPPLKQAMKPLPPASWVSAKQPKASAMMGIPSQESTI